MSRILLVDDSPHAQRMGERILTEEGFEVVTVSNADSALIRMDDVDPDVILADTVMPGRSGYEICQYVKMSPRHRHVRVVLTAGVLEPLDDDQVKRVEADATLKKPFEASVLLATVKPLVERAVLDRAQLRSSAPGQKAAAPVNPAAVPFVTVVDAEQVRAAVTVALDAAMEKMVDEISQRVLAALQTRKSPAQPVQSAPLSAGIAGVPKPAQPPLAPAPRSAGELKKPGGPARVEPVRRVNPLRSRTGSILGLDLSYLDTELPAAGDAPRAPASPRASDAEPKVPSSFFAPRQSPSAGRDPAARPTAANSRPTADLAPGTRSAPSNPNPLADTGSASRPAPSNPGLPVEPVSDYHPRPVADPDPGSRPAAPDPRPPAEPEPPSRSASPTPRPFADPDPGSRPASQDKQ